MKAITRTVWILSLVSLFTDTASEMLYPVMPVYLKSIGFSIVLIGILEGLAEAVAGLSKGYFGKLSDATGRRMPFVQLGYSLSAISKPLMALFIAPAWIFGARTLDRLGKGLRTGARDAVLSAEATPATRGRVFGFHRAMDTLGAVLGPLCALIYLHVYPGNYRTLFLIAFLPGLLAIISTLLLKDRQPQVRKDAATVSFFSFLGYWRTAPALYKRLVAGLLVFTLFNSSDVFLLLRAKQVGMDDTTVIGVYIFYNLVYAVSSLPLGILADKIGFKPILISGVIVFAIVYWGMAVTTSPVAYYVLFFLYGIYAAATEGISKAWISNISADGQVATSIGTYTAFQSIATMLASTIAGLIWYSFGAGAALMVTAVAAIAVAVYLAFMPVKKSQ
jgi:MFS family permease